MSVPVIYFDLGNTLVYGPSGNKQPFDDAVATIQELWLRGYRIGLLSDQLPGTTIAEVIAKLEDYGLESERFDVITISSEFDPPVYKPDPQIFQTALTKAGYTVASADTVFVTETWEHVQAARDLGWRAIHSPYDASCTAGSGDCVDDLDDLLALFPPLSIDLYIRDAPGDPGHDEFTGTVFWNSPDLWIRNNQDGGMSHQNPEAGRDNWFYTRVRNRGIGIARIYSVGYAVQEWAGTQFVYPGDYWPFMAFTFGVNLEPGDSQIVFTRWEAEDVPPEGTHACWLAAVQSSTAVADLPEHGANVWEHNNLAQKNLTIVAAAPGDSGELPVVLGNRFIREAKFYTLELVRPESRPDLSVHLRSQSSRVLDKIVRAARVPVVARTGDSDVKRDLSVRFLDATRIELDGLTGDEGQVRIGLEEGSSLALGPRPVRAKITSTRSAAATVPAMLVHKEERGPSVVFATGRSSSIRIGLRAQQLVPAKLHFRVPKDAKAGETIRFDLVQRAEDGQIVGGITVQIQVRAPQ